VREGALLKFGEGAYGTIQCWPELGDPNLEKCLDDLRSGNQNPLVSAARRCAEWFSSNSYFCDTQLESHATLPRMTGSGVKSAVEAGFKTIKIKRGKDWMRMRTRTANLMKAFPDVRWRIDLNGALESHLELHRFLSAMPTQSIDFIEDPFSDLELCEKWSGFPIAYDWVIPEKLDLSVNYLVAKPAAQSQEDITNLSKGFADRVIFTSYMDHPLGQLWALREAISFYETHGVTAPPLGGLVTHGLYEETPYHPLLGEAKPTLRIPPREDFIQQLAQESWKSI